MTGTPNLEDEICDLIASGIDVQGADRIEIAAALPSKLRQLIQKRALELPHDIEELLTGWHATMENVAVGPYEVDAAPSGADEFWITVDHPEAGPCSIAAVRNGCDEADDLGQVEAHAEWFRACSPAGILPLLDTIAAQAVQIKTLRDLATPEFHPLDTAQEDEFVWLATSRSVGEAMVLVDEATGEQRWTWAHKGPLDPNETPLGWMPLPAAPTEAIQPGRRFSRGNFDDQINRVHALRDRALNQRDEARREADEQAMQAIAARERVAILETMLRQQAALLQQSRARAQRWTDRALVAEQKLKASASEQANKGKAGKA